MSLRPQLLAGLGLLALPAVLAFFLVKGELVIGFAVVNVLLIVWSVYTMFSPVETEHGHGHAAS
ncbi:hypothetical protein [Halorientalis marina]|jgi:hypothetical protein|uniref:hypothetical protein n=1 Tax=Halorientalis marina TaxID=2931976 RepID=UPI001FF64ED1|nr:hypothetical protein [Halorientalis marina]